MGVSVAVLSHDDEGRRRGDAPPPLGLAGMDLDAFVAVHQAGVGAAGRSGPAPAAVRR